MPTTDAQAEQRLTAGALGQFKDSDYDVKLCVSQTFLNMTGCGV